MPSQGSFPRPAGRPPVLRGARISGETRAIFDSCLLPGDANVCSMDSLDAARITVLRAIRRRFPPGQERAHWLAWLDQRYRCARQHRADEHPPAPPLHLGSREGAHEIDELVPVVHTSEGPPKGRSDCGPTGATRIAFDAAVADRGHCTNT